MIFIIIIFICILEKGGWPLLLVFSWLNSSVLAIDFSDNWTLMIHYTACSSLFALSDEAIAGLMPRLMLYSHHDPILHPDTSSSTSEWMDGWLLKRFVRRFIFGLHLKRQRRKMSPSNCCLTNLSFAFSHCRTIKLP